MPAPAPKTSASRSKPPPSLRARAEAAVRASRKDIAKMDPEDVQKLVHELQVHQIELEMQNEELRQSQAELAQSRDRFNDLYDFAPVGYVTLDEVGRVLEANLTVATMLGVPRDKLVGRKFTRFLTRAAQDTFYLHQRAALACKDKQTCQLLLRGPHDAAFFALMESTACGHSAAGACSRSAIVDITTLKAAENALRVSERELRESERTAHAVVDALTAHVAIVDEHGSILSVNDRWRTFAKENTAALAAVCEGANYLAACDSAARHESTEAAAVAAGIRGVLAGKRPDFAIEYPCHSPTEKRWFMMRVTPFPGEGRRCAVISHENITERRHAEEILRQSEERYRTLFNTLIEGFCIIEVLFDAGGSPIDYRFLEFNPAFEQQTGLSNARGKLIRDLAPDHEAQWFEIYGRIALTGEPMRFVNEAKGLNRWFDVSAFRLGGSESRKVAILFNDITESKRAESALRESEARERRRAAELAALLDAVPMPIFIAHDPECLHMTGNRAADDLLRIPRGAKTSLTAPEETKPLHIKAMKDGRELSVQELPAQRAASGVPVRNFEFSLLFDDGATREMLAHGTPLWDEDGRPRGAINVLVDITERKQSEEILRASEAQLYSFVHQAPVAIAMFDRRMNYLAASQRWVSDYGRGHGDLVGLNYYDIHPDLPEQWKEVHRKGLAGETLSNDEDLWLQADGTRAWLRWVVRPWSDSHGTIGGIMIMAEDVTARKSAEDALRASEEQYRQLVQMLPVAVVTCDRKGRITLYNAAAVKLWGQEPDLGRDRWCGSRDRIFGPAGEHIASGRSPMAMAVSQNEPIREAELIVERPDGNRSNVLTFPYPIYDSSGAVTGAVNIMVDITALKVAENALRASERNLRTLSRAIEQSPASVMITNTSGEIEFVNPTFTEVTGYSSEEALGKTPRLLKSGEHPPEFFQELWATITTGQDWRGELCNRKKNGDLYWSYAVIAPIHDEHGAVTHFVGLTEDITEQRRAVEELQVSREHLRAILNTVADAIITIDRGGRIRSVNPATERMFGYAEAEMIGQNVRMLMPSPYREEHGQYLENYDHTGQAQIIGIGREVQARRKDGTVFPIDLAVSGIDHMHLFAGVVRDISERKRLESEVLRITEDERMQVSADLHDGICQELVAISFLANSLARGLEEIPHPLAPRARRIGKAIIAAAEHTRQAARGMSPVVTDATGLMHALKDLARRNAHTHGIVCSFSCPAPVSIENPTAANQLYRIAQEAIRNARLHGRAKRITVRLSEARGQICLAVRDDGRGLPPDVLRAPGMGLRVMRYRAGLIGGQLVVQPSRRGGVEVICRLPQPQPP